MSLKELKTWIKWILGIIILFILILFFQCFVVDKIKEKFGIGKKTDTTASSLNSTASSSSESSSSSGSKLNNAVSDFKDGYNNAETYNYNVYNFDDRILMYEGTSDYGNAEIVLNLAIEDAQDTFYSRPNFRFENCDTIENTEITADDGAEQYIASLENVKNNLNTGAMYTVSFEYGLLHSVVETIVITQN